MKTEEKHPDIHDHIINDDTDQGDKYFERLKNTVFSELIDNASNSKKNKNSHVFFCESGWLEEQRRYFYVKPRSSLGWLFERSGSGWLISLCEKIVADDLFLKKESPIDISSLYILKGTNRLRVGSSIFNKQIVAFKTYEQNIIEMLRSR